MELSASGRVVTAVAISNGNLAYANAGDTSWTAPTNNTGNSPPFVASLPVIYGAPNDGMLWYVDGTNFAVFDPSTGDLNAWTASAGSLPVDGSSRAPRIVETWRGRTCLFAIIGMPYSWFMSAIGDSTNFDYAPVAPGPADAVSGDTAPQGLIGDVVTGFCPYTDDVAFLGCTNHIYMFNGDPNAGGSIDLVSDRIGMAYGRAWCKDPYGNLYFFSSRCGIYQLIPGQQPQRISQAIEPLIVDIDTGANMVSMEWDDRFQGFHIFITSSTDVNASATHYFWEQRTNAWWQDTFNNPLHNPRVCCQFDGNTPQDRVVLIGSGDGVVRYLDPDAQTDDGRTIDSEVIFSPIQTDMLDQMTLDEVQAVFGADSGAVTYGILLGTDNEQALAQGVQETGTFSPGRNDTEYIGRSSHVIYVQVTGQVPWRMERIRAVVRTRGRIAARAQE